MLGELAFSIGYGIGLCIRIVFDNITWIISAVSIAQIWMAGNKHRNAWLLTLGNQALWLAFIIHSENWGLLPLTVAYTILAVRNHLKWNNSQSNAK